MDVPSIVPEPSFLIPEAMELLKRVKRREDLTEDEILILALAAAQSALAAYVEPGNRDAEQTINKIMSVLDHTDVVHAELRKLHSLISKRQVNRAEARAVAS